MLLHINATKTFNKLSQTDMPQRWGKQQLQHVKGTYVPCLLRELPCAKTPKKREVPALQGDILGRLLKGVQHRSAAYIHSQPCEPSALQVTDWEGAVRESSPLVEQPPTLKEVIEELGEMERTLGAPTDIQQLMQHIQERYSDSDISAIEASTLDQCDSERWQKHHVGITASVAYAVYTRVETVTSKTGPHDIRSTLRMVMREKVMTADMA